MEIQIMGRETTAHQNFCEFQEMPQISSSSLQQLSDDAFEEGFLSAVKTERKVMHIVVLFVQESARRQNYLARGYDSLYAYLTKKMKYSGTAANRRIEAANLLNEVPQVAKSLEAGSLNLTQIGDITNAIKLAERTHEEKVTTEAKEELIGKVLNQTSLATQQLCAEQLEIPIVQSQKVRAQKDDSRRVEFTFTKEQWEKFEQLKNQLAHKNFQKNRNQQIADVLETIFDELIAIEERQIQKIEKSRMKSQSPVGQPSHQNSPCAHSDKVPSTQCETVTDVKVRATHKTKWNSVTPKRRKIILNEDKCCQFEDPLTGRKCGSRFNLHVDHIQPKWAGGSNHPSNLRVLCRQHNLYRQKLSERFGKSLVPLDRDRDERGM